MDLPLPATDDRPLSADRLPTLTEVVELGHAPALASADLVELTAAAIETVPLPVQSPLPAAPLAAAVPDADALISRVLAAVAPRIDEVVDTWLREAMEPALARAVQTLAQDAQQALAGTLRDAVEEAVHQAMHQAVHQAMNQAVQRTLANPGSA